MTAAKPSSAKAPSSPSSSAMAVKMKSVWTNGIVNPPPRVTRPWPSPSPKTPPRPSA